MKYSAIIVAGAVAAPFVAASPAPTQAALQKRVFPTGSADVSAFLATAEPSECHRIGRKGEAGNNSMLTISLPTPHAPQAASLNSSAGPMTETQASFPTLSPSRLLMQSSTPPGSPARTSTQHRLLLSSVVSLPVHLTPRVHRLQAPAATAKDRMATAAARMETAKTAMARMVTARTATMQTATTQAAATATEPTDKTVRMATHLRVPTAPRPLLLPTQQAHPRLLLTPVPRPPLAQQALLRLLPGLFRLPLPLPAAMATALPPSAASLA